MVSRKSVSCRAMTPPTFAAPLENAIKQRRARGNRVRNASREWKKEGMKQKNKRTETSQFITFELCIQDVFVVWILGRDSNEVFSFAIRQLCGDFLHLEQRFLSPVGDLRGNWREKSHSGTKGLLVELK